MDMLYVTIEHSGTMAMLRSVGYIGPDGSPTGGSAVRDGKTSGPIFAHLYDYNMPAILKLLDTGYPCTTTFRPDADIVASWQTRSKDLAKLDAQRNNYTKILTYKPIVVDMSINPKAAETLAEVCAVDVSPTA